MMIHNNIFNRPRGITVIWTFNLESFTYPVSPFLGGHPPYSRALSFALGK